MFRSLVLTLMALPVLRLMALSTAPAPADPAPTPPAPTADPPTATPPASAAPAPAPSPTATPTPAPAQTYPPHVTFNMPPTAQPPAEAKKTEPDKPEHMIPQGRLNEVLQKLEQSNTALDQANQSLAEMQEWRRQREEADAQAKRKQEEEQATEVTSLKTLLATRNTEVEQATAARTAAEKALETERKRLAAESATALAAANEQATRYAGLLGRHLDAEINAWPEELRALDPGNDNLDLRMAWMEKSRPLADKLRSLAAPETPAGADPAPKPADPAPTDAPAEIADALREHPEYTM